MKPTVSLAAIAAATAAAWMSLGGLGHSARSAAMRFASIAACGWRSPVIDFYRPVFRRGKTGIAKARREARRRRRAAR